MRSNARNSYSYIHCMFACTALFREFCSSLIIGVRGSNLCLPLWWARTRAWEQAALFSCWMANLQRPLRRASSLTAGKRVYYVHNDTCACMCLLMHVCLGWMCVVALSLVSLCKTCKGWWHSSHTHVWMNACTQIVIPWLGLVATGRAQCIVACARVWAITWLWRSEDCEDTTQCDRSGLWRPVMWSNKHLEWRLYLNFTPHSYGQGNLRAERWLMSRWFWAACVLCDAHVCVCWRVATARCVCVWACGSSRRWRCARGKEGAPLAVLARATCLECLFSRLSLIIRLLLIRWDTRSRSRNIMVRSEPKNNMATRYENRDFFWG